MTLLPLNTSSLVTFFQSPLSVRVRKVTCGTFCPSRFASIFRSLGKNGSLGSTPGRRQFIVAMAGIAPLYLERSQQVMDEGEAEPDRREEAEQRYVGDERHKDAEHVERAAALAKDAAYLVAVGVLGERIVAQQALVSPAEDRDRDDRPKRRHQP